MWFENLTGFTEQSPAQVRENLSLEGTRLSSKINGKCFVCGSLETPSLGELRQRIQAIQIPQGKISLRETVADVQALHTAPENAGALFQVASQFNLLEMPGPDVPPERGVGAYEHDHTQGPACAIAAGAGTIYRNYFVDVNGQNGQTAANQIDCLADIGDALGNRNHGLWTMKNGYALASEQGLQNINSKLTQAGETEIDTWREYLRIGIQWHTEATLAEEAKQCISQAYCSALPVAYSPHPPALWAAFARLILEASYEAALCAGILNYAETGNNTIYFTLLGGGAFGNKTEWILHALGRALHLYQDVGLDVVVVSYGRSNPDVQALIRN